MSRLLALALVLSSTAALADPVDPVDAPLAPIVLQKGQLAPLDGRLVPDETWLLHQGEVAGLRAENASLKASAEALQVKPVVIAGAIGVAVGVAVTVIVLGATHHLQ